VKADWVKRIALALAVAALCAGGFFACFERREVEVSRGESAEARRNRYLALGRLFERMGHAVAMHDDIAQLANLPAPPATVILPLNRLAFGQERSEALLRWVARGGHLVVVTYTVWGAPDDDEEEGDDASAEEDAAEDVIVSGRPDLLLDRFGLRQRHRAPVEAIADAAQDAGKPADSEDEDAPAPEAPPSLGELFTGQWGAARTEKAYATLDDDSEPLELEFAANLWWEDTEGAAVWSVGGESGVHLVEVEHEAGRIAALTSDEPLVNATIGDADHAEFLVRWVRDGREARAPVWVFFDEKWPSLLTLLTRHALPALVGGTALLLLWLWRSLLRFGPALPAPDPARRRWLEHLEAAGRFHWRQDRGAVLLAALRDELARELERKRPAWSRLAERERMERLAHASALSLDEVAHALQGAARAARSFSTAVRSLERIRAAL
jgi:hypothetical protein